MPTAPTGGAPPTPPLTSASSSSTYTRAPPTPAQQQAAAGPILLPTPESKAKAKATSEKEKGRLDPGLYPHLFDQIISHAPREGLIALRASCRDFRDKCDARLSEHLIIQQKPDPILPQTMVPATIRTPTGRAPIFRSLDGAVLRESGAPPSQHALFAISKTLQATQTVDFVGPVMDMTVAQLFMSVVHPLTVRIRGNDSGACTLALGQNQVSEEDRLKLYVMVMSRVGRLFIFTSIWDLLNPAVPYPDFGHPMLDSLVLGKLTLNVYFDPESVVAPPDISDTEYPTGLQDLTIVFRAKTSLPPPRRYDMEFEGMDEDAEGEHDPDTEEDGASVSLRDIKAHLDVVIAGFGFYLDEVPHTLVNICDLNPAWLDADPTSPPSAWEKIIRDKTRRDVRDRRPDLELSEVNALLAQNLRFLTLDEYERELGTHEFRLETVEEI